MITTKKQAMKKIKVTEYLESMSVYDLDGSIKDTIDIMNRIIAKYPNYSDLRINVQNLDDIVGLEIEGDRLETDKEFQYDHQN